MRNLMKNFAVCFSIEQIYVKYVLKDWTLDPEMFASLNFLGLKIIKLWDSNPYLI
jgi:hypothetical protein